MLPNPQLLRHYQYFLPDTSTELEHSVRTHFQDWQEFHLRLANLQHSYLHGSGIVSGLEVSPSLDNDSELLVSGGLAIDRAGQLITLSNRAGESAVFGADQDEILPPYTISVAAHQSTSIYLTVRAFQQLNNADQVEYLAWLQLSPITDINEAIVNGEALVLAVIDVDADGNIADVRTNDVTQPHTRQLIGSHTTNLEVRRSAATNGSIHNLSVGSLTAMESGLRLQVTNTNDEVVVSGPNGDSLRRLSVYGILDVHDSTGNSVVQLAHDLANSTGQVTLRDEDGTTRTILNGAGVHTEGLFSSSGGASIRQGLTVRNSMDGRVLTATPSETGAGRLEIRRLDETLGVVLGTEGDGEAEQGAITVFNAGGAGSWLTADGMGTNGFVFAQSGLTTNGSLDVGQDVSVGGTLITSGVLTAQSNVNIQGPLSVTGRITSPQSIESQNEFVSIAGMVIQNAAREKIAFYRSNGTWIRGGYYVRDNDDNIIAWFNSGGMVARGGLTIRDSNNSNIAWFNSGGMVARGGLTIRDSNNSNIAWFNSGGMVARGGLTIRDSNNKNIAFYRSNGTWIRGGYYVRDNDDKNIAWFSSTGAATRGGISVRNSSNRVLVNMTTATTGAGFFKTLRTNGSGLVVLNSTGSGSSERGHMALYNASNKQVVKAFANDSGHGVMGVLKSDGNWAHWLDASGSKNFVMAHPTDSSKNIVYAAIEGPEAAAYCRGRAKLEEGKAYVEYSDHFALVVNPDTITIQLTPRAASSKGLAVTNITEAGFDVRELAIGKGKYEFDYLIMGVRKDLEHYEPVVNKGFTAFGEYIGDATSDEDAVLASANEEKADFVSNQEDDAVFTDAQIAESDVAEPRIVEPNEIPDLPDASSTTSDLSDFPARLRPDISKPPSLNPAE